MSEKRPAEELPPEASASKHVKMRFTGQSVLVTGGATGIGLACAEAFAAEGAAVIAVDVQPLADGASKSIKLISCDCADAAAIEQCCRESGPIDILVNNVAVQPEAPCHEQTLEEWERAIRVNLTSYFLFSKFLLPHMLSNKKGVIINMGSVQGLQSQPGIPGYAASKGGVLSLTRQLAMEYAPKGIRVLSVSPGTIHTQLVENIFKLRGSSAEKAGAAYPMRRIGKPDEIANVVAFLASDDASFMTAENVTVDGGIMGLGGWAAVA
eukprot:TRINITY_DN63692_c0_g1_i1.p1 TRINITY_DN63692_c0_g1~~TRINITY_DN63692_c0_g1_i1.p1  ORF type:complete len:284 (+),score=52.82 TRINITY_DN63692_c0_g1_i1:53-853(+)